MVERIPQHRHCRECDKAIPSDKQYCDEGCEQKFKATMKSKKKQLQIFYVVMIAIFVFFLAFTYL